MLPVGLIGLMLQKELEGGLCADPPKNKLDLSQTGTIAIRQATTNIHD
jgi:hypothetical protein